MLAKFGLFRCYFRLWLLIFETMFEKAQKQGRLPLEAEAVMGEIKKRLRLAIRETDFQTQTRLD